MSAGKRILSKRRGGGWIRAGAARKRGRRWRRNVFAETYRAIQRERIGALVYWYHNQHGFPLRPGKADSALQRNTKQTAGEGAAGTFRVELSKLARDRRWRPVETLNFPLKFKDAEGNLHWVIGHAVTLVDFLLDRHPELRAYRPYAPTSRSIEHAYAEFLAHMARGRNKKGQTKGGRRA